MTRKAKRTPKQTYVRQVIAGVLLVVCFVGFGWGVHYVSHIPAHQIVHVSVSGGVTIDPQVLEQTAWEMLEGTYIGLIPRTHIKLYPAHALQQRLLHIPRVKTADIELVEQSLHISFTEHVPYALWCNEEIIRCLFVDADGYAFAEAPQLQGNTLYRFVVMDAVLRKDVTFLPDTILQRSVDFAAALHAQFDFPVHTIHLQPDGDVSFVLRDGGTVRTSFLQANAETLQNLSSILNSEKFAHLEHDNFKYIDLRFGNKVYVNEEIAVPVVATSTATSSEEVTEERE